MIDKDINVFIHMNIWIGFCSTQQKLQVTIEETPS